MTVTLVVLNVAMSLLAIAAVASGLVIAMRLRPDDGGGRGPDRGPHRPVRRARRVVARAGG